MLFKRLIRGLAYAMADEDTLAEEAQTSALVLLSGRIGRVEGQLRILTGIAGMTMMIGFGILAQLLR